MGGREIANWIIRDIRNLQRVFFFNIKQLSELVSLCKYQESITGIPLGFLLQRFPQQHVQVTWLSSWCRE